MSVTDGAAMKRWVAAGVRHEVLLRALPTLRHDMAAPVSILRMATQLLKHQLAAAPIDAAACGQRVAVLDQQMGALIDGIRLLRGWEHGGEAGSDAVRDVVTTQALVARCVSLLRPVFDLRGISIDLDPALDEPSSPDHASHAFAWPNAFALRYLTLAVLCHLHDAHSDAGTVYIAQYGADALDLRITPRATDARPPMAGLIPFEGHIQIDATALQCLADDLGYAVIFTHDGVRLCLGAVRQVAS